MRGIFVFVKCISYLLLLYYNDYVFFSQKIREKFTKMKIISNMRNRLFFPFFFLCLYKDWLEKEQKAPMCGSSIKFDCSVFLCLILFCSLLKVGGEAFSYKILHRFFFVGSGGSRAANIASSNTFFKPFCNDQ